MRLAFSHSESLNAILGLVQEHFIVTFIETFRKALKCELRELLQCNFVNLDWSTIHPAFHSIFIREELRFVHVDVRVGVNALSTAKSHVRSRLLGLIDPVRMVHPLVQVGVVHEGVEGVVVVLVRERAVHIIPVAAEIIGVEWNRSWV